MAIMRTFASSLSLLVVLVRLGLVMGGIPQGCPLSMVFFIVALYLPWCRALESIPGVSAAKFSNMYIRLVGQEAAPKKCVFSLYL